MGSENKSSVDMKNGDKIAAFGTQQKAAMKAGFAPDSFEKKEQVVNAKKGSKVEGKKRKGKKRGKISKAIKKEEKKWKL